MPLQLRSRPLTERCVPHSLACDGVASPSSRSYRRCNVLAETAGMPIAAVSVSTTDTPPDDLPFSAKSSPP